MQKLISELTRLYLLNGQHYHEEDKDGAVCQAAGSLSAEILGRHLRGEKTIALNLVSDQGFTRVMVIDFRGAANGKGELHWGLLCEVANALQAHLGLPAPAVSISGEGYALWLSLETPVPAAHAQQFLHLLRKAYFPDADDEEIGLRPDTGKPTHAIQALAELPPSLHRASGKWAAFINPGMGASFSEEPGLEMAPPAAAQAAFLDGLQSMTVVQFTQALEKLRPAPQTAHKTDTAPALHAAAPAGLLLKDATLEDIVRFLHAKNIEPTFRHLIS